MLKDCVKYFKSNKAYSRIFIELKRKWQIYGKLSGYIILKNATLKEKEALKALIGKPYEGENIKFKISDFEDAIAESKFQGLRLKEILECYFKENLITNKDKKLRKEEEIQLFFNQVYEEVKLNYYNKKLLSWLQTVWKNRKYGYNIIIKEYNESKENIKYIILNICKAINYLELLNERIKLAILSAKITLNPHYFDIKSVEGNMFVEALSFMKDIDKPKNAEERLELYYLSGIEIDDISSFTTLYGISLYTKEGLHLSYENFIKMNECYLVSLSNLNKIIKADCKNKIVFVVENQMVFSHICEKIEHKDVSMICTSGQLKTSSLIIIDLLCNSGCKVYYSGDIDPEGILIADKLIKRNRNLIFPWRMSLQDYKLCKSKKELTTSRIKKLDKIENKDFLEIINELKKEKLAGYQELLIEKMIEDICCKVK